jgi:methionyl-tRNA synthetase
MDNAKLRQGIHTVMAISGRGNTYLQASGLNKALMTENPKRCAQVLSRALNLIYVLSALVYPYMPQTSASILAQINAPARSIPTVLSIDILGGHVIGKPDHLFKKIDDALAEKYRVQFGGAEVKDAAAANADSNTKSKKKEAAKQPAARDGPKSPEMIALEEKITEQGNKIRALKSQTPKSPELDTEIKAEVEILKKLKAELAAL